jgi:hypothetical protein
MRNRFLKLGLILKKNREFSSVSLKNDSSQFHKSSPKLPKKNVLLLFSNHCMTHHAVFCFSLLVHFIRSASTGSVTLNKTCHKSDAFASLITFSQSQRYCHSFFIYYIFSFSLFTCLMNWFLFVFVRSFYNLYSIK